MKKGHLDRSQTAVFDYKRYCTKECNAFWFPAFCKICHEVLEGKKTGYSMIPKDALVGMPQDPAAVLVTGCNTTNVHSVSHMHWNLEVPEF
jgi:hypothetical protein